MSTSDIWTIKAALDWTIGYLKRKGDRNPRLSAQWLLSEATGLSRIELYVNFDKPLSLQERDVLRGYVTRRGRGEPLQYITGEVCFRYIPIKVRQGVLIPRPETEVLVSEALALLPSAPRPRTKEEDFFAGKSVENRNEAESYLEGETEFQTTSEANAAVQSLSVTVSQIDTACACSSVTADKVEPVCTLQPKSLLVADIGTGSGCIACALAYEHPLIHVVASDISSAAVTLARENVAELGLSERVDVVECDLGAGIDEVFIGCFDLIVSNPPYIPSAILSEISREVTDYEPACALDGGADGLDVMRRLLLWCTHALKSGGSFAFELHETCLDAAADIARAEGFLDVRIGYDLANRPRVLTGRYL